VRVNEPFDIKGLDISFNAVTTADILDKNGKFGVRNVGNSANVFAKYDLGGGNALISNVGAQASNMEKSGVKDWGVNVMVGFTTGGGTTPPAEQKSKAEPADASYNLDVLNAREAAARAKSGEGATQVPHKVIATAQEPINLAQEEKRLFALTKDHFTKGVHEAAVLYNSLPDEKLKQQFKHDFDANLAKSNIFDNISAVREYTSQEFASQAKEQHVAMAR